MILKELRKATFLRNSLLELGKRSREESIENLQYTIYSTRYSQIDTVFMIKSLYV